MSRLAVGYTQQIQLEWLDWAARMALVGMSDSDIRYELQNRLRPLISVGGDDNHSNRGKVVGVLLRTWVKTPKELQDFRDDGLALLARLPATEHMALHWGMVAAVYPFFGTVVETVGRLTRLQGSVTLAQVIRRVQEVYGERESIERATQRVFYSLHDWGVLMNSAEWGTHVASPPRVISDQALSSWLIESALLTTGMTSISFRYAAQNPVLFPFALTLARLLNERLIIYRQAVDEDVVMRHSASQK